METETITLILEISKPRDVKWLKNGQEIAPEAERFKMEVDSTGMRCTLTIADCSVDDNAEFSVVIDDLEYGATTVSCKVTVTGMTLSGFCITFL